MRCYFCEKDFKTYAELFAHMFSHGAVPVFLSRNQIMFLMKLLSFYGPKISERDAEALWKIFSSSLKDFGGGL